MSLLNLFKKKTKMQCFTTPSHGQSTFIFNKLRQFYKYDISEIDCQNPQKALEEAEKKAAKIYKTNQTCFLTNGSTSGIIAAVLASCKENDNILIWKNAHPSHKNAVELTGANPVFYELEKFEDFDIPTPLNLNSIEKKIKEQNIKALIVTSPNYFGMVSDIEKLQKLCKKNNVYLIVDEAHGALYPFSKKLPPSALDFKADFVIQSLHKTAGGLNPTALLHTNTNLDIHSALGKINTTSPSYPLLASIEKNINFLNSKKGRKKIEELIKNIETMKKNLSKYDFFENDLTKIVVKKQGISGEKLSEKLYKNHIEDEIVTQKAVMFLCGIGTDKKKLNRLEKVLKNLS